MKKITLIYSLILISLAVNIADAQCSESQDDEANFIGRNNNVAIFVGQSFQACDSNRLETISFAMSAGSTSTNAQLRVYSGKPTTANGSENIIPANLLHSEPITLPVVPNNPANGGVDITITLSDVVNLTSGSDYTFTLHRAATGANQIFRIKSDNTSPSYTNGTLVGYERLPGAASGLNNEDIDLKFAYTTTTESIATTADVSQYYMYFPFDNDLVDASSAGVTLNPKTAAVVDTYAAGEFGQAALFNDKPYITANSAFNAGASFSMMMWVNFNSLSSSGTGSPKLIHQEDQGAGFLAGRPLQIATAAQTFNTSFGERAVNSPSSPIVGTWTHIAIVMDKEAGTRRMYVDGVLVIEPQYIVGNNILINDLTNISQLSVGVQKNSSTVGLLDAYIDDLVITPEVLNETTINNIIANGAAAGGAIPGACAATTTFDGTSWDNGAPDATTAAVIDGNYTLGAFTSCDLTINTGGTLNLSATTATIHGDFTNNGTVMASMGTIEFAGDGLQELSGNDFQVGNLIVNNSGMDNIAILSNVEVMTTLDLVDGVLDTTAGALTLNSDATSTAMIDQIGTGSINGDITVERYMSAKRAFRFVSSAVTTSNSINANWQEGANNTSTMMNNDPNPGFGTHITGAIAGANGFDATLTGNASLFTYSNTGQSWNAVANTDVNTLTAGTPYRLLVRGSRDVDLSTNTATADATTLRSTGTIATGAVAVSSLGTAAGDFNFVGNPYQASVNMNSVVAAATNVNPSFYYVWDPQLGDRGAYATVILPAGTNTSGSNANQYLQPGQAAFVSTLSNGAASMLFQESHKSVGQNTATFSTPSSNSSIVGQLFRNENGALASSPQDSFGMFFSATANNGVDAFDAIKIGNQDETIAVQYGADLLAVDNRNLPAAATVIDLSHTTYRVTNYQYKLEVTNVAGKEVYLEDAFLGTSTLLNPGTNFYDFTVDANDNSIAADRFTLRFENVTLSVDDELLSVRMSLYPNPVTSDTAQIVVTNSDINNETTAALYSMTGQLLMTQTMQYVNGTYRLHGLSQLSQGAYFLKVTSGAATSSLKFIKN